MSYNRSLPIINQIGKHIVMLENTIKSMMLAPQTYESLVCHLRPNKIRKNSL